MIAHDFPDVPDEDGDVSVPYEIQHADTLGEGIVDFGDHLPCSGDPLEVKIVSDQIEDFLKVFDAKESDWLEDHAYHDHLRWLYRQSKVHFDCIDEGMLERFEGALDFMKLLPE